VDVGLLSSEDDVIEAEEALAKVTPLKRLKNWEYSKTTTALSTLTQSHTETHIEEGALT
jgi:hypothetical protein